MCMTNVAQGGLHIGNVVIHTHSFDIILISCCAIFVMYLIFVMFVDFGSVVSDLKASNNVSLLALHGFQAKENKEANTLSLNLCCRQDGHTDEPMSLPFTMPFILIKVRPSNSIIRLCLI